MHDLMRLQPIDSISLPPTAFGGVHVICAR